MIRNFITSLAIGSVANNMGLNPLYSVAISMVPGVITSFSEAFMPKKVSTLLNGAINNIASIGATAIAVNQGDVSAAIVGGITCVAGNILFADSLKNSELYSPKKDAVNEIIQESGFVVSGLFMSTLLMQSGLGATGAILMVGAAHLALSEGMTFLISGSNDYDTNASVTNKSRSIASMQFGCMSAIAFTAMALTQQDLTQSIIGGVAALACLTTLAAVSYYPDQSSLQRV